MIIYDQGTMRKREKDGSWNWEHIPLADIDNAYYGSSSKLEA